MKTRLYILVAVLFLGAACGVLGSDDKPRVEILSSPDQHRIVLGETLQVEFKAEDDRELDKIVLYIDGLQTIEANVTNGDKTFWVLHRWQPEAIGQYNVAVVAFDNQGQASDPATTVVSVKAALVQTLSPEHPVESKPTTSNVSSRLVLVTPTAQPPTPVPCNYNASFVADMTIPDNTQMLPGTKFVKTWRLRNSGTCDWEQGFKFVFIEGEKMDAPDVVAVPPTAVGATVDVSILFEVPQDPGVYKSRWRMRTTDGKDFGDRPFVLIRVPSPDKDLIELYIPVAALSFSEMGETNSEPLMLGTFYCIPGQVLENKEDK